MTLRKNQSGFSLVVTVLVLIIILLAGFVGWSVLSKKDHKPSTTPMSTLSDSSQTSSTPQDSTKYLVITEWGVKIPLVSQTEDTTYDHQEDFALLFSPSVGSGKCALGGIVRVGTDEINPDSGQLYRNEHPEAKRIGDHYFYYLSPQATCSDDKSVIDKAVTYASILHTATGQIQAE